MTNTTTPTVHQDLGTMHRRAVDEFNDYFGSLTDEQAAEADGPDTKDLVARLEAEGYDMARIGRHLLAEFLDGTMNRWGVVHAAHDTRDN